MDLTCAICDRPADAPICVNEVAGLTRALDLAFAVLNDPDNGVAATVSRLDRMPERGGRGQDYGLSLNETRASSGKPLQPNWLIEDRATTPSSALRPTAAPVNLAAAARADAAVNVLTTWARHIAEETGRELPLTRDRRPIHGPNCQRCAHPTCDVIRAGRRPRTVPAAVAARYIAVNADRWLRHRDEAVEAWPEILRACRDITGVVDSPPARRYAGKCKATWPDGSRPDCVEELYAVAGRATVTCPACGCTYDLKARTRVLLAGSADQLLSATEMARALSGLGRPVTASSIRNHGARGRLHRHPAALADGDPLYRLGDVVDLLAEQEAKRADLEQRRERRDKERRDEHRKEQAARLLETA